MQSIIGILKSIKSIIFALFREIWKKAFKLKKGSFNMYYLSLIIFSLIMCITPGPNNIMIMNSGINFGLKATYRHILGITFGCYLLFITLGLGLENIFAGYPVFRNILDIFASFYLLFLAWKYGSAKSGRFNNNYTDSKPLTFMQALLYQCINPKILGVSISLIAIYIKSNHNFIVQLFLIATIFISCVSFTKIIWLFGGLFIKRHLNTSKKERIFNIFTGILLALAIIPILFSLF